MALNYIDWLFIALFLLVSVYIGFKYASRAGQSLGEFFLSGRKLPWWIAGFSMVATTFAADTPLAVTEIVNNQGIAGNWFWWNMLIGGMFTTLFFARLWRRAEIMTDVEFVEIRYGGKPAAFLRGFKSIYLGLFMNSVIIGWVNVALMTILQVFFEIPEDQVLWYVAGAMLITASYSSLSGLWGVALTDLIQFSIAIIGSITLAVLVVNSEQIGGITGLEQKLPAGALDFIPAIGDDSSSLATGLTISLGTFLAFIGVQWWASWYPGAEPGGGGYVAQRMMSARNEKHSLWATMFFQIAHYCLRPWPWILVGLSVIVLYPELGADEKRLGYVMAMRDFLPPGLRGLLLVTFLAAYMSTISTQLNWGSSYFINDLYKRFLKKEENFASEEASQKHYVLASRIFTIIAMFIALYVTTQINTIKDVWAFVIETGAGLGLVLILRWYWWRVNAWSEITATIVPFLAYGTLRIMDFATKASYTNVDVWTAALTDQYYTDYPYYAFPNTFFITVGVTTAAWLLITYLTAAEKSEVLQTFYNRVRPQGAWQPVATSLGIETKTSTVPFLLIAWISALLMTYSLLFLIGKIILLQWSDAGILLIMTLLGFMVMRFGMKRAELM